MGGARTAIFNWLYARHHEGKFLLRIEDTDFARSDPKMVQAIYDGLKWLGLDWDDEPVFQSQRIKLYQQVAQQLIVSDKAYYCYCSAKNRNEPQSEESSERVYRYDGRCRNLSVLEKQRLEAEGVSKVIRFKVAAGKTSFFDEVHGSLTVDNKEIDDFVILRSDGIPTYNFAVVVDDHEMNISHVIRGDDHLSNTSKQVMIYRSLSWVAPKFAHVPLILGSDKKRLSKRHGATSVSEYEAIGYLPEAMLNFLSLLGWSPGDDREIMTRHEMIESFSLKGISKKSAVFDEEKLIWMNGEYISRMNDSDLFQRVFPILQQRQIIEEKKFSEPYIKRALSLLKPKIKKLNDFANLGFYFFKDPEQYDEAAIKKYWQDELVKNQLKTVVDRLTRLDAFEAGTVETAIRNLAEESGISAAKLIHPIRLALTGFGVSPGLFELMEVLGKESVLRRINNAVNWLTKLSK
ncbi:MAG: glutamate--tRNA ligase [bacterium]|nr:glutamate--tRNA ligase [bacterium]